MRQLYRFASLLLLLLNPMPGLCFANDSPAELPKLLVGAVFPVTGDHASFGEDAWMGLTLAHELHQARDPRRAASISLVRVDDRSQGRQASIAAVDELLQKQRPNLLIAGPSMMTGAGVVEAARRTGIPVLLPLSAGVQATGIGYRLSLDDEALGAALARHAYHQLNARTAAILEDPAAGASELSQGFTAAFTAAGGKIGVQGTLRSPEDEVTLLERLVVAKPDVVLLAALAGPSGRLLQAAKTRAISARFLGGDAWDTETLIRSAKAAAAGHDFVTHFAIDQPSEESKRFVDEFQKRFQRPPSALSALYYDAYNVAIEAVGRANSVSKDELLRALGRTAKFPGVTGSLTLQSDGRARKPAIVRRTSPDGAKFLTTVEAL